MTLSEAVVVLNREIERTAIEQDFTVLQKLAFVKAQIMAHECRGKKQ